MVPDYLSRANLAIKDGYIYRWFNFFFLLRCITVISDGLWRYCTPTCMMVLSYFTVLYTVGGQCLILHMYG
jgi:hypothetical protein